MVQRNIENVKHTLKEYLLMLEPSKIQIVIGDHIINIDTEVKGSWFIIRNFENETFTLKDFKPFDKYILLEV